MAAVVPLAKGATNASQSVSKALTGDIYTRRWQTIKTMGEGKKKRTVVVDHEAHANAVSIGLGVLALGAAATGVAVAMWLGQRKLSYKAPEGGAKMWRLVRLYDPTTKTVVDEPATPAWDEETREYHLVANNAPAPAPTTTDYLPYVSDPSPTEAKETPIDPAAMAVVDKYIEEQLQDPVQGPDLVLVRQSLYDYTI